MNNAVVLLAGVLPLYVIRFSLAGIPTNLFEAAVWATALVSLCIPRTRHQLWTAAQVIPRSKLIFIGLFLLAAVISTAISPVLQNSLGILKGWVVTPVLFGLLVRAAAGKTPGVNAKTPGVEEAGVIRSLILSGTVVALFGFSQIQGFNRIYSVYDVPNSLALFLVPISVLAAWIGIKTNNKLYQYSAIIMLIAIIATQSFGAITALIGTMIVAVPLSPIRERARVRATYIGMILLLVAAVFFTLSGRFAYLISHLIHPNTTNSATVRLQLWDIGINLIKKHPILGIGLGQFEPAYQAELHRLFEQSSRGLQPEFVFRDPHNWIISFWLNLGIGGLISFIALNYLALKNAFLLRYKFNQPAVLAGGHIYQQAIALAIVSILIFGLFDTIYWKNDLSALWWMLIFLGNAVKLR